MCCRGIRPAYRIEKVLEKKKRENKKSSKNREKTRDDGRSLKKTAPAAAAMSFIIIAGARAMFTHSGRSAENSGSSKKEKAAEKAQQEQVSSGVREYAAWAVDHLRSGARDPIPSVLTAAVIALLLIVRAFIYGFRYFPYADDKIQYWYFRTFSSFGALQAKSGVLGSRPLAGLADYFVWSRMPFVLDVIMISVIFAVSAVLLRQALRRYFDLSALFPVLLTLMPLGIEGSYWLSASTRIIMGMLAAVLAEIMFIKWLDTSGVRGALCLAASFLLMTASYGFYEQTGLLASALLLVTAFLEGRRSGLRPLGFLLCLPSALAAFYIPTFFRVKGSPYSARIDDAVKGGTPLNDRLGRFMEQLDKVFFQEGGELLTRGFSRGAAEIAAGGLAGKMVLVVFLCLLLFAIAFSEKNGRTFVPGVHRHNRSRRRKVNGRTRTGSVMSWDLAAGLIVSAVLTAAPLTVFMLMSEPSLACRNALPCFAGIALFADLMVSWLSSLGGEKWRRLIPAVLAALLALYFMVCGISEMWCYKTVWEKDSRLAVPLAEALEEDGADKWAQGESSAVIGAVWDGRRISRHIESASSYSWSLGVMLRYTAKDKDLPNVVPLDSSELYDRETKASNDPRLFKYLYYYDEKAGTIHRVHLELSPQSAVEDTTQYWYIMDSAGSRYGTMVISSDSGKVLEG